MFRGLSLIGKVALATAIGGAVPLISGEHTVEPPISRFALESAGEPKLLDKKYGIELHAVPPVPEYLKVPTERKVQTQPAPAVAEPAPEPAVEPQQCPFDVRAIVSAPGGPKPFAILGFNDESFVRKAGELVQAGNDSYRVQSIELDYLILEFVSKEDAPTVRCSLQ